jgi:hypothetical protein
MAIEIRLTRMAFLAIRVMPRYAEAKRASAFSFTPVRMGKRFFSNFFLPRAGK